MAAAVAAAAAAAARLRFPPRRNQYASTGTTVIETSSEATSATAMVTANGRNNSPVTPDTTATGKNTATVVAVDAVTAPATSLTEATMSAGVSAACPVSRRLMFSSTTIESSTTRPTATVRAASVKMLSENPPTWRPIMAISSDSGIEIAVMIVERSDNRNSRITSTAKLSPRAPSTVRSWMDCSIRGAWSKTMLNAALLPMVFSRPGMASATACEMATESPPVSLSTDTLSAGRPSERANEDDEIDSTLTSAICDRAIGPSLVGTARAWTCLIEVVEFPTCTASSRVLSYAVPAGITVSCDWIDCVTAAAVRSFLVRSAGRSVTVSWVVSSPVTSTRRTPSMAVRAGTAVFCTSSPDAASGRSVEAASSRTGMSSVLPVTTSVSTSVGRFGATESTALRMSLTTLSSSRPKSQLTVMVELPLTELDVTSVTPATPVTARSMGVATLSATICGVAPG